MGGGGAVGLGFRSLGLGGLACEGLLYRVHFEITRGTS